ncbi:MAG: 50S ribosomal protein L3 N(5)-glutamine methyltransferase [Hydrogenophilales bacterium]
MKLINNKIIKFKDVLSNLLKIYSKKKVFFGHGFFSAKEEIYYTTSLITNIKIEIIDSDTKIRTIHFLIIRNIINTRVNNKTPLIYAIGFMKSYGAYFVVSENVLVPRSHLAELIFDQFKPWLNLKKKINMLDLCTGSGHLAILSSKFLNCNKVIASDICDKAIEIAKLNASLNNSKINVIQSNLFSKINKNSKFDIIISNPPYVLSKNMKVLPDEYRKEPKIALDGGFEGISLVEKIINQAQNYLSKTGILILEVGDNKKIIEKKFNQLNIYWVETENSNNSVCLIDYNNIIL